MRWAASVALACLPASTLTPFARLPDRADPAGIPQVLEAKFGSPLSVLGDGDTLLSIADPPEACSALANGVEGTIVLVVRGA